MGVTDEQVKVEVIGDKCEKVKWIGFFGRLFPFNKGRCTYIRRSVDVQKVILTSYVRSVCLSCPGGFPNNFGNEIDKESVFTNL